MIPLGAIPTILGLFVRLIGTPDYKPLATGLKPADAQTLGAQLDAQDPHQASADGKTISVPADKLDAARMQTASQRYSPTAAEWASSCSTRCRGDKPSSMRR